MRVNSQEEQLIDGAVDLRTWEAMMKDLSSCGNT